MGLRALALDSSQNRCLQGPIQFQLNTASLVIQDIYLLVILYTVYSGDFL